MEYRITVHNLDHMRSALAAAAEAGVAVTLVSAPAAAAYLGAAVFREMAEAAARAVPGAASIAVLDCGDDPGLALNALRHGVKHIRVDVPRDVRRRIADIAARCGAELDGGGEADLDLADAHDPAVACRRLLASRAAERRA